MKVAKRASLIDEEARQMRAQKVVDGASSSKIADVERITKKGDLLLQTLLMVSLL